MSLENKVVVITGGGTGIGADAAQSFYGAGAKVVLNGRRKDKLSQTAAKIAPSAKNITYLAGDIGQPQTSQQIVELAIERFGRLDILINNAGVFHAKPFLNHTEEEVNTYLNLVRGYLFHVPSCHRRDASTGWRVDRQYRVNSGITAECIDSLQRFIYG